MHGSVIALDESFDHAAIALALQIPTQNTQVCIKISLLFLYFKIMLLNLVIVMTAKKYLIGRIVSNHFLIGIWGPFKVCNIPHSGWSDTVETVYQRLSSLLGVQIYRSFFWLYCWLKGLLGLSLYWLATPYTDNLKSIKSRFQNVC